MPFRYTWHVSLDQVDTSGRIFHSRAFEAFHAGVESLVEEALGAPYPEFYEEYDVVTPVVHVEADFHGPIEFGDTITLEITPELGEHSLRFVGRGFDADSFSDDSHRTGDEGAEVLCTLERTQATLDIDSTEPIAVPDGVHDLLKPYMRSTDD